MSETSERGKSHQLALPEPAGKSGLVRVATLLLPLMGLALVVLLFVCSALIMRRMGYAEIEIARFFSPGSLLTVVFQTVVVAIAGLGMTFVIVSGGIDLSVGSVIAFTTVVTALALQPLPGGGHLPVWLAGVLGIVAGGLCGCCSGLMITGLRIVPFIATLGMWSIARGVAKLLSGEQKIDARESWLNDLMAKLPKEDWLTVEPSWFRAIPDKIREPIEQVVFSPGLWIMVVAVVTMWIVLRYTTFGRYTIAIGSNEPTARLCGVRVNRTKILIYTLAGILTGVAGLLQFSRLTVGDPTVAAGMELDVIAAVVIGGGSLSGGEGSIMGTLIGALTMSFLRSACDFLGWGNYVQEIFIGIFIVIYVAIDQLRRARSAA
jgi:ribose transport system permease protein